MSSIALCAFRIASRSVGQSRSINVGQLNASGLLNKLSGRLYHGVESFFDERAILTIKRTAISVFVTQLFARQEIDHVRV